jgi:transcriptional regulator with XRE-family HTH domain
MLHPAATAPTPVRTTVAYLCRILSRRSQREVADAIGVKTETLRSWEAGRSTPQLDRARRLAGEYGIPVDLVDAVVEVQALGLDPDTNAKPGQVVAVLRIPERSGHLQTTGLDR